MNSPEFRLYYDDTGKVLFYTCEKLDGNFIVVNSDVYFQSRFDIKIVDNKIISIYGKKIIAKLQPNTNGTGCYANDISIIYDGPNSKKWSLTLNERS